MSTLSGVRTRAVAQIAEHGTLIRGTVGQLRRTQEKLKQFLSEG
jgi:hypothetical protein